jgi:hypothetical protein
MNKTDFFVQTYGVDALETTFKNLSSFRDKRSILMAAFRKAVKPTVDIMYAHSPVGKTQNLRKSIGTTSVRGSEIGIYVGARIKGRFKGYIGHIIEEGTVDRHYITKNGNQHNTGRLRYSGHFKRAAESTEQHAIDVVADEWYKAIARHIMRSQNDRQNN